MILKKHNKNQIRKTKIRSKIYGTSQRPRLSVFRAHKHLYAQIIDDQKGETLISANEKELSNNQPQKTPQNTKASKAKKAKLIGELIAQKAIKIGIKKVVFDRGHFKYHGRIKILAKAARSQGLKF